MKSTLKKLYIYAQNIFIRNKFLKQHEAFLNTKSRIILQWIIAGAFLLLSFVNLFGKSYSMLVFTLLGFIINAIAALISKKYHKINLCIGSTVLTCSILFGFFVVYGGNDGFSCLWVVLFPFVSMVVMDFILGLISSILLELFIIIVFWTPARALLCYPYHPQFLLRFPLFFLVALLLGVLLTTSLQKSQYNEYMHMQKLEELNKAAHDLARLDTLTQLANRRSAYEQFQENFTDKNIPHCIVMGDIDYFKTINDSYGHEFGDEVLVKLANFIRQYLPEKYLKSRWGGEEFLMAANESKENVYKEIERLREKISQYTFLHNEERIQVSMTFGIAEYFESSQLNEAIQTADERLYKGKRSTRNCTIMD